MNVATKNSLRSVLAHVCALGVGCYFLYAAYPKIKEPRQFRIDIGHYQILPREYENLAAVFLPWLEAVAAAALIIPVTRRAGATLITGLLVMFVIAVSWAAFYKGLDIRCGCTGRDSAQAGWTTILLDAGLLAATAASVFLPVKRIPSAAGFHVLPGGAADGLA
ncbi:MAG: DoxX family protein [Phycisphaerae bacterium]|nr:DoxX family protein [Phycisphaerae bacterium]